MNIRHWRIAAAGCALLACASGRAAEPAPALLPLSFELRSAAPRHSAGLGLRQYVESATAGAAPRWRGFSALADQRGGETLGTTGTLANYGLSSSQQRGGEPLGMTGTSDSLAGQQSGLSWSNRDGATFSVAIKLGQTRDEPGRTLALGWTLKY
jgi:hypothetical protein